MARSPRMPHDCICFGSYPSPIYIYTTTVHPLPLSVLSRFSATATVTDAGGSTASLCQRVEVASSVRAHACTAHAFTSHCSRSRPHHPSLSCRFATLFCSPNLPPPQSLLDGTTARRMPPHSPLHAPRLGHVWPHAHIPPARIRAQTPRHERHAARAAATRGSIEDRSAPPRRPSPVCAVALVHGLVHGLSLALIQ